LLLESLRSDILMPKWGKLWSW